MTCYLYKTLNAHSKCFEDETSAEKSKNVESVLLRRKLHICNLLCCIGFYLPRALKDFSGHKHFDCCTGVREKYLLFSPIYFNWVLLID